MLTITDNYFRKTWIYPTNTRSDASSIFHDWQLHVEAGSNEKVMAIRCNNVPELKKLYGHIKGYSGSMELTVPYTPEQNGIAECINRTIIEKAKAMLIDVNLPHDLWPEVVQTVAYLHNQVPTRGSSKTPNKR